MGFIWDLYGIYMGCSMGFSMGFIWDLHGMFYGIHMGFHGMYMGFSMEFMDWISFSFIYRIGFKWNPMEFQGVFSWGWWWDFDGKQSQGDIFLSPVKRVLH